MSANSRLKSLRKLLAHAREILQLDIGFRLWDGSTVPDDLDPAAFAIRFADEGVMASLLRSPNPETLLNLWVSSRVDLENGDMFDLVARRPKVRTREIRKQLSKFQVFNTARKFLFVDRGGPWPLSDQPDEKPSDGNAEENQKNIAYHYDVSNAFYELFLDDQMVYTCGYFTDWNNDIHQMQTDKLEMICRKLRLKAGEKMLDIGFGWGSLALYAAKNYGVHVTGVTLSERQLEYATQKAEKLGLSDRVNFILLDYAKVEGEFDKISSIGMHEAIGIDNYPTYYSTIHRVLKPGGIYLHHAITRPAKKDARTFRKKNKEFKLLTKYIFPGGELDHIGNTVTMLEQHGLEVHDVENWREHYQRTCRLWHDRLLANYQAAVAEVGEVKTRLWLVYLGGCSIAFERNTVRIYQTVTTRSARGSAGLPPTRADLYRQTD
ncbi:SAM-dependent methyltransferase [Hoeflea alexandrii]|uniref:Methyltransferase domain-containing protein n=1 Tax=Hoeflea alexandrii TaxID=288436 RepID=A0ABT1CUY1_9HYPH|nr:cyclopropane-fatty-acyl-phospholipid synthase family protein [Hoeflea alexandrii]MCO6410010.1 methyltransferase domain-containing protein [Hoeflea alexandrii]MCY0152990.1 cyclopropane-fatty-acyl-phospholipid synthase family protein [Hoeflea alexandrii]